MRLGGKNPIFSLKKSSQCIFSRLYIFLLRLGAYPDAVVCYTRLFLNTDTRFTAWGWRSVKKTPSSVRSHERGMCTKATSAPLFAGSSTVSSAGGIRTFISGTKDEEGVSNTVGGLTLVIVVAMVGTHYFSANFEEEREYGSSWWMPFELYSSHNKPCTRSKRSVHAIFMLEK